MQDNTLKPLPDTDIDNWQKAELVELRTEVQNLRHWCGQLFLQVKEWTTRSNDLQQTIEQFIKLHNEQIKQLADINDDITLIMESLGLADAPNPDDTPQPSY